MSPPPSQTSPVVPSRSTSRPSAIPTAAPRHGHPRSPASTRTERRPSRRRAPVNAPFQFQEIKHS